MIVKNIRAAISPVCNMKCRYCSNNSKQYARMEDFRRTPLSKGVLSTEQWMCIFQCFYDAGFRGISLTGGEPTLNKDWMEMLKYCRELGFVSTEITSNLLDIDQYKEKLYSANYITKFKVSLDTFDSAKFYYLTKVDALETVISNIVFLKKLGFNIQLNRVTMKSTEKELLNYIEQANALGVNVKLLDLVYYKDITLNGDVENWRKEFVSSEDTWEYLRANLHGIENIKEDLRYGYETRYKDIEIILKDSRLTKRSKKCEMCPLYCQEGIFTVRIASDGTITVCPDYANKLPYIDGIKSLEDNSLTEKLKEIYQDFEIPESNYFDEYLWRLYNGK